MQLAVLRPRESLELDSEAELIDLARLGGENAIRTLIQRNNRRLFRVARSILRDEAEAEDVVQESYVKAFTRLQSFRGASSFSTWLTRIALNEALGRKRRMRPTIDIDDLDAADGAPMAPPPLSIMPPDADSEVTRVEVREVLEAAMDSLPEGFRTVAVLRDVEGLSVEETAELLGLNPNTVKTRLYRAHRLLRRAVEARLAPDFSAIFPFAGVRCADLGERVVERLRASRPFGG